jgi:hypothetical protein
MERVVITRKFRAASEFTVYELLRKAPNWVPIAPEILALVQLVEVCSMLPDEALDKLA